MSSAAAGGGGRAGPGLPDRLASMEAVLITLMAVVVLLTAWVAVMVVYKLFKAESER